MRPNYYSSTVLTPLWRRAPHTVNRHCWPGIGETAIRAVRPVGYVAGWGHADGMCFSFGWGCSDPRKLDCFGLSFLL